MIVCSSCHRSFEPAAGTGIPYRCANCGSLIVGLYSDLVEIGHGAMGTVYRARRPDMGNRVVAIKIPNQSSQQIHNRFEREIAASARLHHANIVRAFDRGQEQGRPYLVMEFVEGRPLRALVEEHHPLPVDMVARIVRDVAAGLVCAAEHGAVNRDIKPDNIIVTRDGQAKIMDYGLGLIRDRELDLDQVTRPGVLLGTPGFMPPEQFTDPHDVTIAADVYSLGGTAVYSLTGRMPFGGSGSHELLDKHLHAERPDARQLRSDVPSPLAELLKRLMSVKPSDRPSPSQVVAELDAMATSLNAAAASNDARSKSPAFDSPSPRIVGPSAAGGVRSTGGYEYIGDDSSEPPPASIASRIPTSFSSGAAPRGASSSAADPEVDFQCPSCGEEYRLRASSRGKLMTCTRPSCGRRFRVEFVDDVEFGGGLDDRSESSSPIADVVGRQDANGASPAGGVPDSAHGILPVLPAAAIVDEDSTAGGPIERLSGRAAVSTSLPTLPAAAIVDDESGFAGDSTNTIGSAMATPLPGDLPIATTLDGQEGATFTNGAGGAFAAHGDHAFGDSALNAGDQGAAARAAFLETSTSAPRRRRGATAFVLFGVLMLALMGSVVAVRTWLLPPPNPSAVWKKIQEEEYQLQKWGIAEKQLTAFAEDFPDSPHSAEVPFFLRMCETGRVVHSATGDIPRGLEMLQKVFLDFRDQPEYERYASDLYMASKRLTERALEQAEKQSRTDRLEQARAAHELLTTVAQSMSDAWVPEETAKVTARLDAAEASVVKSNTRQRVLDRLASIAVPENNAAADSTAAPPDGPALDGQALDAVYEDVERLLADEPELRGDAEIQKAFATAYASEASLVKYEPVDPNAASFDDRTGSDRGDGSVFVVWDDEAEQPPDSTLPVDPNRVRVALAGGVLYAFDDNGRFLWAIRLGIDSHRLPTLIPASRGEPAVFVAVSTAEQRLLAIHSTSGRVVWEYRVGDGSQLAAPLTISRVRPSPNQPEVLRGLLPTAEGEVHVLELARGRRIGRVVTGHPMTAGGAFDSESGFVFFPSDSRRIFVIDPQAIERPGQPVARSVLYSNHIGGTLRSPPVVVGQYLVLSEADGLDRMRLRAFKIDRRVGFPDPKSEAVRSVELQGWSWFTPATTPDRVTVVTDKGRLGIYGVNLDRENEALFPVIHDDDGNVPSLFGGKRETQAGATSVSSRVGASSPTGSSTRIDASSLADADSAFDSDSEAARSLAVYSDAHLLWLSAGGRLRLMALDELHQQVRQIWPEGNDAGPAAGIPMHEARMDETLEHIYLTTAEPRTGAAQFTAVESMTGERVWRRQLGIRPAVEPEMIGGSVRWADRSGRVVQAQPAEETTAPTGESVRRGDGPAANAANSNAAVASGRVGHSPAVLTTSGPFAGSQSSRWMTVSDDQGVKYLVTGDDEELALYFRRWDAPVSIGNGATAVASANAWLRVSLPAPLFGRPAILGDTAVVPCADGRLYRRALNGSAGDSGNELPFQWPDARRLAPDRRIELFAAGPDSLFAIANHTVRLLEFGERQGVRQWRQSGESYVASHPVAGPPIPVDNDGLLIADDEGNVARVNRRQLNDIRLQWRLGGRITSPPLLAGTTWIAVTDHRNVVALSPTELGPTVAAGDEKPLSSNQASAGEAPATAPDAVGQDAVGNDVAADQSPAATTGVSNTATIGAPIWKFGPTKGRIIGRPVAVGAILLVTDESGAITAMRAADGRQVGQVQLADGDAPSGAAVPFGRRRKLIVPLIDGTLRVVSTESPPPQAAMRRPDKEPNLHADGERTNIASRASVAVASRRDASTAATISGKEPKP